MNGFYRQMLWEFPRTRSRIAAIEKEQHAMSIAVSNLTKAVALVGPKLDLIAGDLASLIPDIKAALDTAINSNDDLEAQEAADQLNNVLLPRLDTFHTALQTEAQSLTSLGQQMPTGSVAATTGATKTTDGGLGVEGVAGTKEDSASGAVTGTGTTPSDPANTGIIGNKPEDLAPGSPQAPASAQPTGEEAKAEADSGNQSK